MSKFIYIIGCGGVGSWLAHSMNKLATDCVLTLVDGDTLEERNLDRQLYSPEDIGQNKAEALALMLQTPDYLPEWFARGVIPGPCTSDVLMVCADNDPCRLEALKYCDEEEAQCIIAANETTSSEAYYYRSEWKGTERDPRVYYPHLLTNHDNDPRAGAIGCTGVAQENNRQLVSANFMAAALAQHLYVLWIMEFPKMPWSIESRLPYKLVANLSQLETIRPKLQTETTTNEERTA